VFVGQNSTAAVLAGDDDANDGSMLLRLDELDAALQRLELQGRLLEERIRSGQYIMIITISRTIWQQVTSRHVETVFANWSVQHSLKIDLLQFPFFVKD